MLKILQARLQQYMNWELSDVQAGFRKARGIRDQIAKIHWIIKKAREFQKNIYFCFVDYDKGFDGVDHNKLREILKEMGIPEHLSYLLRILYAGQEATVTTRNGTTLVPNWERRTSRLYTVTCLFNLYAESVQFSSVAQSCPTLCDPMDCSTSGLPVQQLPKFTQTHVHWLSVAI